MSAAQKKIVMTAVIALVAVAAANRFTVTRNLLNG